MSNIILASRGDEQKIVADEKAEWVIKVLIALGINEEALKLNNEGITEQLNTYNIEVLNNCGDESVEIKKNNKIVAEWKHPKFILKKDMSGYYYEIHLNEWALPFQMTKKNKKH